MRFQLHLIIQNIEHLPVDKLEDCSRSLMVEIKWRGSKRISDFLPKSSKRICTSKQPIQANGIVRWNEEFDHIGKLKRIKNQGYRSWNINIYVQEFDRNSRDKLLNFPKAKIDIKEFLPEDSEKVFRIPLNCRIGDHSSEVVLEVKLQITELQLRSSSLFSLTRALSLRSFSWIGHQRQYHNPIQSGSRPGDERISTGRPNNSPLAELSSDDEPECRYRNLQLTNILVDQNPSQDEDTEDGREIHVHVSPSRNSQQPSLGRLLSWHKVYKRLAHSREVPLLNKSCRDIGGDDIDMERRYALRIQSFRQSQRTKVHPEGEPQTPAGFEDDGGFHIGSWETKRILSRDGQMELVADAFLASIDQCSEKASGEGACTVLAVVIADWLLKNPETLPLRYQLDDLVREGSLQWRKLCGVKSLKERFYDQHFDLDTVLEAEVRSLKVAVDKSFVGFFGLDDIPQIVQFLQGAMSFDSIWDELLSSKASEEQHIYITSWNDHFFVLKIESNAIYLVDTLGERLVEGCNQAYILKFSKESAIHRNQADSDHGSSQEIICEGLESCKEYIKGFLAALPVRELQSDIERGRIDQSTLHRRLQIEFHYVSPCI
ncbi:uncharacterized protein [Typha latifolia]|uniref:uncharacterized protein n=1 Tax=Typha latifolia TaxID=4733 RepID=UPI003C30344B